MNKKTIAIIEILISSALWSTAGILMKQVPWSGVAIAGIRSPIAGMVVLLYMRITGQKLVFTKHSLFGGVALAATMLLFCSANKLTTAANAIVLQFTSPAFVMIISALFMGVRFSKADIIAVVLTFGGISLFFFDKFGGSSTFGNIVAVGSGLTFGCYYISLGGVEENERMSAIAIGDALCFFVGLPVMLTSGLELTGRTAFFLLVLGVFQLGIPYVLLAIGSGICPPLVCSLLGALEPLLNPVWVLIFDGERPGIFALLGAVVVIATISVWCAYNAVQERKRYEEATAGKSE